MEEPNSKCQQILRQISIQERIQDQAYSYSITGGVLSALECYANRFQKDKKLQTNIFSAYNNFNCGNTKTTEQLKSQIISQLVILNASHKMYIAQYGHYDFPHNLSQKNMIEIIKNWANWVPKSDQKYYASAVAILEGKEPESYINELNDGKGHINPNWLICNIQVIHNANQVGKDAVKNYNEKGELPGIEMNSDKVGNEYINQSSKAELQRRQDQLLIDELLLLVEEKLMEQYEINENDIIKAIEKKEDKKYSKEKPKEEDPNVTQQKKDIRNKYGKKDISSLIEKFSQKLKRFIEKYQIYFYNGYRQLHIQKHKELCYLFILAQKQKKDTKEYEILLDDLNTYENK